MARGTVDRVAWHGDELVAGLTWFDWEDEDLDQRDLDDFASEHPREAAGLGIEALYELAVGDYNINFYHFQAESFTVDGARIEINPAGIGAGSIPLRGAGANWGAEVAQKQEGPTIDGGREVVATPEGES
jgi:hypothetical protein